MAEEPSVALLVDELQAKNKEARIRALQHLGVVADALGPERVLNELLPFLETLLDDEDDVVRVLAEELGNFGDKVGDAKHRTELLAPFSVLVAHDDSCVRACTVQSLRKVIAQFNAEQMQNELVSYIGALANSAFWTQRVSAAELMDAAYSPLIDARSRQALVGYVAARGEGVR